ncbi:MAG: hypothetical protein WBW38_08345 [Candidatus Sulfotelmatobacter sp.]
MSHKFSSYSLTASSVGFAARGKRPALSFFGAFLGRILLKPTGATKSDWLLGLPLGLLILTIVGFIPYLGGLVRFGVVCLGLGAFAGQLYRASRPVITA